MSIKFTCDDKATLVAYLYGEIDPPARQAVDDHLAQCTACAAEVSALGDVRSELGLWAPPDVELDFQVVRKTADTPAALPSNVLRPARWWHTAPVWAQAAAAVLVVGVALGAANVQVKSGPEGLLITTGWMSAPVDANASSAARGVLAQGAAPDQEWKAALVSLEQQLRSEIRARDNEPVRAASAAPADDVTLRRVQQLIGEAEQRHERALAARFVELTSDMDMQRRADLQLIRRGMTNYESEVLRQRQMLNNVIRISGTPQQ